ncbi:haloacid dehalogenase [Enterococcus florum]|uniref:Haloacid dehalogenase n=1 Tax=Enterococcus florum TaxID=2480627 RepID=A0A4V0WP93_9ENTE|nr:HAD family phosphatase [Enterococcus florum]GCF93059.1 haloacid dehalogenase [Enterococcus florum]
MANQEWKLIIFDMDGLLVDTERVYRDGWLYAIKKHEVVIPDEVVNNWGGKGTKIINQEMIEYTGSLEKTNEVRATREAYFFEKLYDQQVELKPYAKEVLSFASEHYLVGLASSSYEGRAGKILEALDLRKYIQFPVFGDNVANLKPCPDVYLEVLKRAEIAAEQALAVEDSITGATAAKGAGLKTVMVPDSSFAASFEKIPENVIKQGPDLRVLFGVLGRS